MDIFEKAENKFEDSDREELETFAKVLGVSVHHKHLDDTIRENLLEKLGQAKVVSMQNGGAVPDVNMEPIGIQDIDELFKLNLSGRGKWEGRRRVIEVGKPEAYEGLHPQFVKWGAQSYWIRYNSPVSVPLPVFNILKNCKPKRLHQRHLKREDGVAVVRNQLIPFNRFQLSDRGDDQETTHLPVSQKDQFRKIAEMTDDFKIYNGEPFTRGKLEAVLARLRMGPKRFAQSSDEQVRAAIIGKLGLSQGLAAA